ncbi:MAG: BamA/TamA family outer membrane protein [Cyclobacteriaceae bacterium]|nr:BamA/TamA family outer membrane protein [Cyclobacteriaceae bacterium]
MLKSTDKFRWLAGFTYTDNSIARVDIARLNEGKDPDELLPDVPGLYENYVSWGAIPENEADGNKVTYLKAGLVYDTRNEEAFPTKGIWADAILSFAPTFLGDWDYNYTKLTLAFRQYVGFGTKNLVFGYRLGYQGTVSGTVPFHMQPHIVPVIMIGASSEGFGGSRSLRGVMRNRVVGDGIILGNAELRWRFLQTTVMKQKIYIGTNVFADFGRVVKKIDFELNPNSTATVNLADYFDTGAEAIHISTGIGLKFGLNDNFIVSFDYGMATDKRDGDTGLYINMNWLF